MWFKRKNALSIVLVTLALSASANMHDVVEPQKGLKRFHARDTFALRNAESEFGHRHKMNMSLYPVQMSVTRRSIKVYSDHNQVLPIYRHNGTFYMVMRLNKGVNWINGLPEGQYYINNKPILIK